MKVDGITTASFPAMKAAGRKIVALTAYDYYTGRILDEAGVDMVLVGDSLGMTVLGYETTLPVTMEEMLHHTKAVARGVSKALLVADMPFMAAGVNVEETVRNAGRFVKEAGAGAVKLEGGAEISPHVEAVIGAGIPVLGHIGLTPQDVLVMGGYKVQGKSVEAAKKVRDDAVALQQSGVFSVVLECLPAALAKEITGMLSIPTIGIGAGQHCDGQIVVLNDILGMYHGRVARFVKVYAGLGEAMTEGVGRYCKEVREGKYPDEAHSY